MAHLLQQLLQTRYSRVDATHFLVLFELSYVLHQDLLSSLVVHEFLVLLDVIFGKEGKLGGVDFETWLFGRNTLFYLLQLHDLFCQEEVEVSLDVGNELGLEVLSLVFEYQRQVSHGILKVFDDGLGLLEVRGDSLFDPQLLFLKRDLLSLLHEL